jgi:hypothetical protein
VVEHRHFELVLCPDERGRIETLAGEKQRPKLREIELLDEIAVRVFALDRSEGGRRREQARDLVLRDHPPEHAGIRRSDRLALEQHRGAAAHQRSVHDVGMAHHPADVGRRPVDLPRLDAVDVLHGPLQRDQVPPVITHDALRLAGRARGVEDVERVVGIHRHAVVRCGAGHDLVPVEVPAGNERLALHRTLVDDAMLGFVLRLRDGRIEELLVGHDPPRLDAARRRDDDLRLGVVDATGELVRSKAAEDHRVNGPEPCHREHGDHGFGDHRHVDDDPVTLRDAQSCERPRAPRDLIPQRAEGVGLDRVGDRAVVDQRQLFPAPVFDVPVDGVVAGVDLAAGEPPVERLVRIVEDLVPLLVPVDLFPGLGPKPLGVVK